jgi:hypothetical protein
MTQRGNSSNGNKRQRTNATNNNNNNNNNNYSGASQFGGGQGGGEAFYQNNSGANSGTLSTSNIKYDHEMSLSTDLIESTDYYGGTKVCTMHAFLMIIVD